MRTSRISEHPTALIAAGNTHAAGFAAIQSFTAGVMLGNFALSNPFSAQAQESKQAISRLIQMFRSLGYRTTVSDQCGSVLEELVRLILAEEMKALISDGEGKDVRCSSNDCLHPSSNPTSRMFSPRPTSTVAQSTRPDGWCNLSGNAYEACDQPVEAPRSSDYRQQLEIVCSGEDAIDHLIFGDVPTYSEDFLMMATGSFSDALALLQNFSGGALGALNGTGQSWIWDDSFLLCAAHRCT